MTAGRVRRTVWDARAPDPALRRGPARARRGSSVLVDRADDHLSPTAASQQTARRAGRFAARRVGGSHPRRARGVRELARLGGRAFAPLADGTSPARRSTAARSSPSCAAGSTAGGLGEVDAGRRLPDRAVGPRALTAAGGRRLAKRPGFGDGLDNSLPRPRLDNALPRPRLSDRAKSRRTVLGPPASSPRLIA